MNSSVRSILALLPVGLILAVPSHARATIATPTTGSCSSSTSDCVAITNTNGTSGTALSGTATAGTGVYGTTSSGMAMYGYAFSGTGVQGYAIYGNGMHGMSAAQGHGVYGQTSDGCCAGVFGYNTSRGGFGVLGTAVSVGVGVFGENNDPVGWAGYFHGNVYSSGTYQGSDERLKTDIKDAVYGLSLVGKLRPVTFRWKEGDTGTTQMGLIAQEVQKVIPEIVRADSHTGMLAVNYTSLVPVLIKAMQEQQATIAKQEARIASLEARRPQASLLDRLPAGTVALGFVPLGLLFIPRKRKQP